MGLFDPNTFTHINFRIKTNITDDTNRLIFQKTAVRSHTSIITVFTEIGG